MSRDLTHLYRLFPSLRFAPRSEWPALMRATLAAEKERAASLAWNYVGCVAHMQMLAAYEREVSAAAAHEKDVVHA